MRDPKNKLICKITFPENPKKGWFGSEKPAIYEVNAVDVKIFKQVELSEIPVCEGTGMYTRYLQFEGKVYWRHNDKVELWVDENKLGSLMSSSLRRKELELIAEKKYAESDKIIENVEALEDKDTSLRKKKKSKK